MGCTVADDPLEATPDTPHKIQGALHDSFSTVPDITEERGATSTPNSMDIHVSFQEKPADQVSEVAKARIRPHHAGNGEEFISRVPLQGNQDEEYHDRPLSLDQEGTEFEVESLVAKGRIGRRVWYKAKWKGYPEADNSWVKKKDIGTGATANYEARHPQGQSEFKLEQLVLKHEMDGIILAKVVAAFEANFST
ncbi:hypothetical protein V3481_012264 [Fusarium oxysporum f. sp. vasinfectum]